MGPKKWTLKVWGYLSDNSLSVDQLRIEGFIIIDTYLIANKFKSTFKSVFSRQYITDATVQHFSPGLAMEKIELRTLTAYVIFF